jgi:hypothetical protein
MIQILVLLDAAGIEHNKNNLLKYIPTGEMPMRVMYLVDMEDGHNAVETRTIW